MRGRRSEVEDLPAEQEKISSSLFVFLRQLAEYDHFVLPYCFIPGLGCGFFYTQLHYWQHSAKNVLIKF